MGISATKYKLSDGQIVTVADVMAQTGLKVGAARVRLTNTRVTDEVFANRGLHINTHKKKLRLKYQENLKKIEQRIIDTKPFYADAMYRLALKTISHRRTNERL